MQYTNSNFYSGRRKSEPDYYYVGLTPMSPYGEYVKYKWPDGSIHFNCLRGGHSEFRYVGPGFAGKLKCNEKGKELVSIANRNRERIRPYLSGTQKFVVLNPDDLSNKVYILFKDGTLFSEYGTATDAIFTDRKKLEDFLISVIKRINNSK